ncbi:Transposable element Tc1 transposase [Oopsacas minuta]|uniref:Transposable element Tc1 transposase n=1 Tax=Oopsacas minuta TaxID=111878 RepID=A0AAV7JVJ8_9METZ|nr:Transposable element Tc1 transposase [Oopsacas minuta]
MAQEATRNKVVALLHGGKHSAIEISQLYGVNKTTVYRIKERFNREETLNHKRGAGRPDSLRNKIALSCTKYVSNDRQKPCHEIAEEICLKRGINVSTSTVYRCFKSLDYSKPYPIRVPILTEKNRLARIE